MTPHEARWNLPKSTDPPADPQGFRAADLPEVLNAFPEKRKGKGKGKKGHWAKVWSRLKVGLQLRVDDVFVCLQIGVGRGYQKGMGSLWFPLNMQTQKG